MANFTRFLLSESTSGTPIIVVQTATPGTAIHTAVDSATDFEEIYLWATNVTGQPVLLTIEWGGVSDPGSLLVKTLPIQANSPPMPIATGQMLNGGLLVKAFSDAASAINITGYVNRIA